LLSVSANGGYQNSLDIMPSHLLEVTSAIADQQGVDAAKSYVSGRAFSAPRNHAMASLPEPLIPNIAPLVPRKNSSKGKAGIQKGGEDGTWNRRDEPKLNPGGLESLTFGGGGDWEDPRAAAPGHLQEMWEEQQAQHNNNQAKRRSSLVSITGSKKTMELQQRLAELKE
jgi:hypothetical protein